MPGVRRTKKSRGLGAYPVSLRAWRIEVLASDDICVTLLLTLVARPPMALFPCRGHVGWRHGWIDLDHAVGVCVDRRQAVDRE